MVWLFHPTHFILFGFRIFSFSAGFSRLFLVGRIHKLRKIRRGKTEIIRRCIQLLQTLIFSIII